MSQPKASHLYNSFYLFDFSNFFLPQNPDSQKLQKVLFSVSYLAQLTSWLSQTERLIFQSKTLQFRTGPHKKLFCDTCIRITFLII